VAPATVSILTEGVLKAMLLTKLKNVTAVMMAVIIAIGLGAGLLAHGTAASGEQENRKSDEVAATQKDAAKSDTPKLAKDKAAEDDLAKLQGTWRIESMEYNGEKLRREQLKDGERVRIVGEKWITNDEEGRFWIDPSKSPKTIDITSGYRMINQLGIYRLERNRLTICMWGGDEPAKQQRPKAFATAEGSPMILLVYQRVSGKEAEEPGRGKDQAANRNVRPSPPAVAVERAYVITSRLLEAGGDAPKESMRLPKVTVDDGQQIPIHIPAAPQNLLEKVVQDENIKIGVFFDVRVKRLAGNKARLILSFHRNEIEQSSVNEIRVLGHSVQAIQDVEFLKPVKVVLQKEAKGMPVRWVEITVDQIAVDEVLAPASTKPGPKETKR
jgi:uncharacterized protein (TIGR03067 family)